jgi:hypothetical protein
MLEEGAEATRGKNQAARKQMEKGSAGSGGERRAKKALAAKGPIIHSIPVRRLDINGGTQLLQKQQKGGTRKIAAVVPWQAQLGEVGNSR